MGRGQSELAGWRPNAGWRQCIREVAGAPGTKSNFFQAHEIKELTAFIDLFGSKL
jgi:hypothetical protein